MTVFSRKGGRIYNRSQAGERDFWGHESNSDSFDSNYVVSWIPGDCGNFYGKGAKRGADFHRLADAGCGACDAIRRGDIESRIRAAHLLSQVVHAAANRRRQPAYRVEDPRPAALLQPPYAQELSRICPPE